MQQRLSKQKIKEKLEYLHSKLPKHPTAVLGLYSLPKHFAKEVLDTNFSQPSLQKISDHIGYFLGLLNSVKVTIGIESSDYMLAAASDVKKADQVGLYKVLGEYNREIQLTKKFRFKLEHILAILAHESTHNYLYHQEVRELEESENEILTELATTYLGLGHLLIPGYKPIIWTSDQWNTLTESGYTTHTISIGYVPPETIRYAIVTSAELRHWKIKEVLSTLSFFGRIIAYFQLWPYKRKLRKAKVDEEKAVYLAKKRASRIDSLSVQVDEVQTVYNQVCELMQHASNSPGQSSMPAEDSSRLVEIANKIAIGEPELEIKTISEGMQRLKNLSTIEKEDIDYLSDQVTKLMKSISNWHELLNRYV